MNPQRDYHREYYLKHRARILARVKARAEAKKAEISAYKKHHYAKNREKDAAKSREYYVTNKARILAKVTARARSKSEDIRAYKQQWWTKNRAQLLADKVARYGAHREEILAKFKALYAANPEPRKERTARMRARELGRPVESVDLKAILRKANGLCGICKQPLDLSGINFDHIIPLSRGGTHTAANIQATHARCNRAKGNRLPGEVA
jgi:5-methylcytosine-specific restriction endonuclease McrA